MFNKKTLLQILSIILTIVVVFAAFLTINLLGTTEAVSVCSGVIDLGTTTDCIGFTARVAVSAIFDTYEWGACSAVVKTLEDGDTIVGRNLDMTLSNTPVYVGKTAIAGYYETIYGFYVPSFGPDYDECMENGVPGYISQILPFAALDSLNSEGLYIQINMREDQQDESGDNVFACAYTNKDADTRISAVELPTYVTLRCKNVDEAVELINSLDIYTLGEDVGWPFSYIIADADGNCGLLELGCNEARWIPYQNIQTNFYISEDFGAIQKYKQGIGRYDYIEENIDGVSSEADMLLLMESLKYSDIYSEDSSYDIRSEMSGEEEYLTTEYLENEENWSAYLEQYQTEINEYLSLTDSEKRDASKYWHSVYTAIVNCTDKTVTLSFFEDYSSDYSLEFDQSNAENNDDAYTYSVISLEIFSILISLLLLYANSFENRRNLKKLTGRQRLYSIAVTTNIIGLVTDAISWYYDGNTEKAVLLKCMNGISVVITYVLLGEFSLYLSSILNERKKINDLAFRLFVIACFVAIVITAVLYENDLLYIVTDAVYYEAPLYTFYSTISGAYIAVLLVIIFYYRELLGVHDCIAILLYVTMPILSAVVSSVMPQISLGYPACTLAFLIVYIMLQSETTGRLRTERNESSYYAHHDELTGLLSRRSYIETVDKLKTYVSGNEDKYIGVIFADINGLKYTNDRFGHLQGDQLLVDFTNIAEKVFAKDSIFRISGDEFVIIISDISREELAEKESELKQMLNNREIPLACIGSEYGSCNTINELVQQAETKMYKQKENVYIEHPEIKR